MGIGRLALRAGIGAFFVGHGTQKLFGWFGGGGPAGTGQFFEQAGLRPGKRHALAAGAAEAGGGLLLALGLATPLATTMLQSVMLTAIRHVHWQNGPWSSSGGYEYNATLVAALFLLADEGPGPLSLDAATGNERRGLALAVAGLGAAAAASYAITARTEQPVADEATPREQGVEEAAPGPA